MTHHLPTSTTDRAATTGGTTRSVRSAAEPVVVTSAWPWRGSEKRTIALTPVVGLAVAVLGQGWWWAAVPVALGVSFWLYRIGRYRKQRSSVTATITHDRIALRALNTMGDSAVDLGAVDQIAYRDFQSDRVLLLVGNGTAARVPARLLDEEPVREVLTRVLARGPKVSAEARDLLVELGLA
ncbi:hypothetical protein [Nocardioides rubriscoriae]|uniref:hypothetical protein n=1 Tax=Nocardioides rubriscoriae TaxID=642762 RepID=UPI0011DFD390|nr:hypothetical protein [Nocardioides rubriscoriae]